MSLAQYYIDRFNNLHGKRVKKDYVSKLLAEIKAAQLSELKPLQSRVEKLVSRMNGRAVLVKISDPVKLTISKKVIRKKKTKVAVTPKSKLDNKRPLPPVESKESDKVAKEIPKKSVVNTKPVNGLAGFTTADKMPEKPVNVFHLNGEIGKLFGEQQRYRLQIIIDGEKHSSKSEFVKQLANAFIDAGFKTALIDYEQGGLISKDTQAGINRNVSEANKKKLFVSGSEFPATLEALKKIANQFDAILIDSGSKLEQMTNEWLDTLRTEFPNTIWVVLMHQNSKGTTKGGSAAGYNAPVVVKTYRPDATNPLKNYAYVEKNRGNITDKWYLIAQKKVVNKEPV